MVLFEVELHIWKHLYFPDEQLVKFWIGETLQKLSRETFCNNINKKLIIIIIIKQKNLIKNRK